MKATLKVKNFGPIKDVELDLRDVNVFIGPQASGKSVLAKLYTICKSPQYYGQLIERRPLSLKENKGVNLLDYSEFCVNESEFHNSLNKFMLGSFLTGESEIFFSCDNHTFIYKNQILSYFTNLFSNENLNTEIDELVKLVDSELDTLKLKSKLVDSLLSSSNLLQKNNTNQPFDSEVEHIMIKFAILNQFKKFIYSNSVNYIPSERNLAVLLKKAALNLMHQKVPIPEHLLEFAANYNIASDKIKNLDLSYLKSSANYQNIDGEDFILDDGTTLKLSESASGLQSVVPLLLTLENLPGDKNDNAFHHAIVIEEPETNLFPKAQYALLKYLERNRPDDDGKIDTGSVHIYTTHSPFILSSLNNMLYAYKKGNSATPSIQEEIAKILPKENWISPERFSAYQIIDGKAESIFDRASGLIQENIINQISEDIIEDFRNIALATMEE